jgi:hypothetical protein
MFNYFEKKKLSSETSVADCFRDRVTFHETCLGSAKDIAHLTISPDGKHEAYLVKHGEKWSVAVDGTEGGLFDGISGRSLRFSRDGTRLAYAAERSGKWLAVVDGMESSPCDAIGPIAFSPDNRHIAYLEKVGDRTRLVVDGGAGQEYEALVWIGFLDTGITDDRWQPAYLIKQGIKFHLIRGTQEGQGYERIGSLYPSPHNGSYLEEPGVRNFVVSSDNKHVAFCACESLHGGPWMVVRDGVELGPYSDVALNLITFGTGTDQFAYVFIRPDGKYVVVRDGVMSGVYDRVVHLGFSPDGKHLIWTAKVKNGWVVFRDQTSGRKYQEVDSETWSPSGGRLAYRAKRHDKWLVVVDENESKVYEGVGEGSLSFTGDSQHIAYVVGERGKFLVVIDTTESERYDALQAGSLITSPDGRFIAYQVALHGQSVIRVNEQESLAYGGFLRDRKSIYCRDNTFHAIAARESWIFRVDVQPEV